MAWPGRAQRVQGPFDRAVTAEAAGLTFRVLSPFDALIHRALNNGWHYRDLRLIWICDGHGYNGVTGYQQVTHRLGVQPLYTRRRVTTGLAAAIASSPLFETPPEARSVAARAVERIRHVKDAIGSRLTEPGRGSRGTWAHRERRRGRYAFSGRLAMNGTRLSACSAARS